MNLVVIEPVEDNSNGFFVVEKRHQAHFNDILKLEDGDFINVGILNGQKGIGQVRIFKLEKSKNEELIPIYSLQLLPLEIKTLNDAFEIANISIDTLKISFSVRNSQNLRKNSVSKNDNVFSFGFLSKQDYIKWCESPYKIYQNVEVEKIKIKMDSDNYLPQIDIFMALTRPKLFEKLIQYFASMNIGRICFFAAGKTDIAYLSSSKLKPDRIQQNLLLGLEQGVKTVPPDVKIYASLDSALENFTFDGNVLLAHPYDVEESKPKQILDILDLYSPHRVTLVLGPEGGFYDSEIIKIKRKAEINNTIFIVGLGTNILKCEVALLQLIGQVSMILEKVDIKIPEEKILNDILNPCVNLPIRGRNPNK